MSQRSPAKPAQAARPDAPAVRPLPERELDDLVDEINATVRRHGLQMAVQVGTLVLDRFFGGSVAYFRQRDKGRNQGFRRLTAHPDLSLSGNTLQAYVSISIQLRELDVAVASQLPLDRHRCLLPLHDPAAKNALARRCLDEDWDVERLRREVASRRGPARRGGRPPIPLPEKVLRDVERALRSERMQALAEGPIAEFGPEQARELVERLDRTAEQLAALRRRLEGQAGG